MLTTFVATPPTYLFASCTRTGCQLIGGLKPTAYTFLLCWPGPPIDNICRKGCYIGSCCLLFRSLVPLTFHSHYFSATLFAVMFQIAKFWRMARVCFRIEILVRYLGKRDRSPDEYFETTFRAELLQNYRNMFEHLHHDVPKSPPLVNIQGWSRWYWVGLVSKIA